MLILYTTPGCASCRKVKQWFKSHEVKFVEKNIFSTILNEREIRYLLSRSQNGTEDLISTRSKIIKEEKINIEEMGVNELIRFIQQNPSILKRPIIMDERNLMIGYDEEEIDMFLPKVEASFNNKRSTITIVYKEPNDCGKEVDDDDCDIKHEKGRIGVQIHGNQFRIYCGPSSGDSPYKDESILFNEFICLGWFENYISNKIRNKKSNMRDKGYCVYKKDYLHMYQYWKITEKNTSYDFIYSEIKQELVRAKKLIDDGHVHF